MAAAGVIGPTEERLELAGRVRVLRDDEGLLYREIMEQLGISHSYAQALYTDPDGSKARARKDRYAGTCVDCGAPTCGSDGPDVPPERCWRCRKILERDSKFWTREVVIDAIRRFADDNGRPPLADEWITRDTDRGYPPRSAVYRSTSRSTAPFASWAEAIEAAGFPRFNTGRRSYKEEGMTANGYVVMRESADGVWEFVASRDEKNAVLALNAAMNGHKPEGRWVAIPTRHFRPRVLKPRTIYDFVEETVAA